MDRDYSLINGNDDGTFVPFTDIMLNVAMGFAMMVFMAFALIRPELTEGEVDLNAEYLITMRWPDGHPDDIDLYVQDEMLKRACLPLNGMIVACSATLSS
jgi:hypothetical protein